MFSLLNCCSVKKDFLENEDNGHKKINGHKRGHNKHAELHPGDGLERIKANKKPTEYLVNGPGAIEYVPVLAHDHFMDQFGSPKKESVGKFDKHSTVESKHEEERAAEEQSPKVPEIVNAKEESKKGHQHEKSPKNGLLPDISSYFGGGGDSPAKNPARMSSGSDFQFDIGSQDGGANNEESEAEAEAESEAEAEEEEE